MSHTTKSVMDLIVVCKICHKPYIPQNDEVCDCAAEEAKVQPWESQEAWHESLVERDNL